MAWLNFETPVREKTPVLSIVLNDSKFGGYDRMLPRVTQCYYIDRASRDYAKVVEALSFYTERIEPLGAAFGICQRSNVVLISYRHHFHKMEGVQILL
jgi:thiamine pyrophosphate-dependent acetolactate synthase large subunit-like protein